MLSTWGSGRGGGGTSVTYSPARGFYIPEDAGYGVDGATIKAGGANGTAYVFSLWLYGSMDQPGTGGSTNPGTQNGLLNIMLADPATNFEVTKGTSKGIGCVNDAWNFNNSVGVTAATDAIEFAPAGGPTTFQLVKGRWNHFLVSWDTSTNHWAFYLNGVDMRGAGTIAAVQFAANCQFDLFNANGFKLNNFLQAAGPGLSGGWYADVWVAQAYIGNSSNALDAATLAKFYDTNTNQAVDLGSDGSNPGQTPVVWIRDRGDGVPSQAGSATAPFAYFAGNNTPVVGGNNVGFPAPFGPGAAIPTTRVAEVIVPQYNNIPGSVLTTTFVVSTGGQPILSTDFVVITFTGLDAGTISRNPASADGFTRFPASMSFDTNSGAESCIFYGYAGSNFPSGTNFSVTVTIGYSLRTAIGVHIFRNVTSVDQLSFSANLGAGHTSTAISVANGNVTSGSAGSGNTTKKQLLLTFAGVWKGAYGMTPPALGTGTLATTLFRQRSTAALSSCQIMLSAEEEAPAGQPYARTITMSTADNWQCISMGLCVT